MYTPIKSSKIGIVKETLRLLESSIYSIQKAYNHSKTPGKDVVSVLPGLIDQAIFITLNMVDELNSEEHVDHGHYLLILERALETLYDYAVELTKKENLTEEEVDFVLRFIADSIFNIERIL